MNRIAIATIVVAALCVTACQTPPGPASSSTATTVTPATGTTTLSAADLERRAVEAAIWGMPIVAADAIRQGFLGLGAKPKDIAFFSAAPDWKFQTTTPNASTHYIYSCV